MNEIKNKIIERIKTENIRMKPRWHFVLQGALLFFSVMVLLLILIYLFSFLILFVNSESFIKMPLHEVRDYINLTESLPWIIILFSVIGFIIVETLVNKFEFAHRKPFLYSFILILIIIVMFGYIFGNKKYHMPIRDRQPFNLMYERYNLRERNPVMIPQIIEIRTIETR
jgi:cellulose synthase/poly-beta-1,6-N-acetylglucosamine synthase-like glycosyltransferase